MTNAELIFETIREEQDPDILDMTLIFLLSPIDKIWTFDHELSSTTMLIFTAALFTVTVVDSPRGHITLEVDGDDRDVNGKIRDPDIDRRITQLDEWLFDEV